MKLKTIIYYKGKNIAESIVFLVAIEFLERQVNSCLFMFMFMIVHLCLFVLE